MSLWQNIFPQRNGFSAEKKAWKKEEVGGKEDHGGVKGGWQ